MEVYTGELTAAQLGRLRSLGLDQEDIATSKASAKGKIRTEVALSGADARLLIKAGLPLAVKTVRGQSASARMKAQAAAGFTVFRSYSEPGGIKDELLKAAADHPGLAKAVTIGKTVQGLDGQDDPVTGLVNSVKVGADGVSLELDNGKSLLLSRVTQIAPTAAH